MNNRVIKWNKYREDNPAWKPEIKGIVLEHVELRGINFSNICFGLAVFWDTDMEGANFRGANLSTSIITKSNFKNTDMSDTDMTLVLIRNSDFTSANLTGVDLTDARIDFSIGLSELVLKIAPTGEEELIKSLLNPET